MSKSDGVPEDVKQEQQKSREWNAHTANLSNGQATQESDAPGIIPEFIETELEDPSVAMLENLIVPDLVLANLDKNDVKAWQIRIRRRKRIFLRRHPPAKCHVTGDDRVYINNDADDSLTPLSPRQKEAVEHFFDILETRPTRALNMKQQEVFQTSITESVVRNEEDEPDNGGSNGILGWIR